MSEQQRHDANRTENRRCCLRGHLVSWVGLALGLVAVAVGASRPTAEARDVLFLDKSDCDEDGIRNLARKGLLSGELVRQAFLIAARDELGLATRDARLGDRMPVDGDNPPFVISADREDPSLLQVRRGFSGQRKVIADLQLEKPLKRGSYKATCDAAEKLSRTKFVEILREAGFSGEPIRETSAPVPQPVADLLSEMTFTSQFSALRQLHELARNEGGSDAVLGGLVRGYGNLGVLTEFYWHPAHKVFKARAMLYAERMCAGRGKDPWVRWHRAYGLACAGLPRHASEEIQIAEEAWHALAEGARPQRPGWVDLIGAHCRYELSRIEPEEVDEPDRQFAYLLRYLTVEQSGGNTWAIQTALETLPALPECYRVHDALCQFGGVAVSHSATVNGLFTFGQELYARLEAMPGLPQRVRQIVKARPADGNVLGRLFGLGPPREDPTTEFKTRRDLMAAMLDATSKAREAEDDPEAGEQAAASDETDQGEPSWTALGTLIRELSFTQVWRRVKFEGKALSVSPDEFIALSAPLVELHPMRPFIDQYAWEKEAREKATQELLQLELDDLEPQAMPFYRAILGEDRERALALWRQCLHHQDYTAREFLLAARLMSNNRLYYAQWINKLVPESPYARATLLSKDWDHFKDRASKWEKEGTRFPYLMQVLGIRYRKEKRYEDAERCLRRSIELCPAKATYESLAKVYKEQGNMDQWVATLEDYLDEPSYGLEHCSVQKEIAEYFMKQGEWERALPYAEGAAECYSAWGLVCAARCHEGLKNWEEAERYYQACSRRYRGSRLRWYFFCRRTGKGDLDAARRWVEQCLENPSQKEAMSRYELATSYLMEKQYEPALELFQTVLSEGGSPLAAIRLALTADEVNDSQARDAALENIRSYAKKYESKGNALPHYAIIVLAATIAMDLERGGKGDLDLALLEQLCPSEPVYENTCFNYCLGWYLALHGRPDKAVAHWKRCLETFPADGRDASLAGMRLVEWKDEPDSHESEAAEENHSTESAEPPSGRPAPRP